MINRSVMRGVKWTYTPFQPFAIKGDFDHPVWIDHQWKERIVFDSEGNILRGADLEEYYWKLRKGMNWHPMFGDRFMK